MSNYEYDDDDEEYDSWFLKIELVVLLILICLIFSTGIKQIFSKNIQPQKIESNT